MSYQHIKWTSALAWMMAVAAAGVVAGVSSATGLAALAAFGFVPPGAAWFIWQPPEMSLNERICEARR
jgi:hypothetical protein